MTSSVGIYSRDDLVRTHVIAKYRFQFRDKEERTFLEMVHRTATITSLSNEKPLSYEEEKRRSDLTGKIVSQIPDAGFVEGGVTKGIAEIAYPLELCGLSEGLPLLLSVLQYISVYDFVEDFQLLEVSFPPKLLKHFEGPRLGLDGLLKVCGRQQAPLFGIILKPRQGLDPQTAGALAYQAAAGGIDYVIDDELLVDPPGCRFAERISCVMASLKKARQDYSSCSTVYIANVTAEYKKMKELVRLAEDEGVHGLMVNVVTMGFDVLRELSSRKNANFFLVTNTVGRGLLTNSVTFRMAEELLCSLARLAGADAVYTGVFAGALKTYRNTLLALAGELQKPIGSLKPSCAVVSGGVGLQNLLENASIFGANVMIQMGQSLCALYDDGEGLGKGVRALREVFELYRSRPDEAYSILLKKMEDVSLAKLLRAMGFERDLRRAAQRT